MNFSTRLRILREKTNLTQKEFANLIKMPYTTYNGYEIGKREPDINTIKFFADYFNVTSDYLLGRTDKPNIELINKGLPQELINEGIEAISEKKAVLKEIIEYISISPDSINIHFVL